MPYIEESVWHSVVHLVGTGDVVLVVLALAGQTNSATTLDLFLPTSETGHPTGPWWSNATARADYAMTTMTTTTSIHNGDDTSKYYDDGSICVNILPQQMTAD